MSYEYKAKMMLGAIQDAKDDYINATSEEDKEEYRFEITQLENLKVLYEDAAKADEYEAKAKAFDAISYIIKKRANDDFSSVNNDYEAGILRAYEVMECNVDDFYRGDTDA